MAKLTDFEALQIAAVYFQGEKTPHVANTSDQRIEMLFDLAEKFKLSMRNVILPKNSNKPR